MLVCEFSINGWSTCHYNGLLSGPSFVLPCCREQCNCASVSYRRKPPYAFSAWVITLGGSSPLRCENHHKRTTRVIGVFDHFFIIIFCHILQAFFGNTTRDCNGALEVSTGGSVVTAVRTAELIVSQSVVLGQQRAHTVQVQNPTKGVVIGVLPAWHSVLSSDGLTVPGHPTSQFFPVAAAGAPPSVAVGTYIAAARNAMSSLTFAVAMRQALRWTAALTVGMAMVTEWCGSFAMGRHWKRQSPCAHLGSQRRPCLWSVLGGLVEAPKL